MMTKQEVREQFKQALAKAYKKRKIPKPFARIRNTVPPPPRVIDEETLKMLIKIKINKSNKRRWGLFSILTLLLAPIIVYLPDPVWCCCALPIYAYIACLILDPVVAQID